MLMKDRKDRVALVTGSTGYIGGQLIIELLKNGWAKVKELKREPKEEDIKKKELESEASMNGKGVWNPHGPKESLNFILDGPDPDRNCCVVENGEPPCIRTITCKVHTLTAKRMVLGRSLPFDELILLHHKKNARNRGLN